MKMIFLRLITFLLFVNSVAAQLLINVGSTSNDGTGDTLRAAFGKANTNFTDLFGYTSQLVPASSTAGDMLQFNGTSWVQIPKGTTDFFLKSGATTNLWSALPLGGITSVTGTYVVVGSDNGKIITLSPLTASVTQPVTLGTFPNGYMFTFRVISSGTATITATGLIDGSATMVLSRGQSATLFSDGTNYSSTFQNPNLNGEQTANTFSILNQKSLATAQTLNIYHSTDNFIQPTNEARLQVSAAGFDWDEIGTNVTTGGFKLQNNGATKVLYDTVAGTLNLNQGAAFSWSPAAPALNTQDTSLRRKSAGVVTVSTTAVSGSDSGQLSTINGTAPGVYFTQTADAVAANSVSEISILGSGVGTKTVAAGALNVIGKTLRVTVRGIISNYSGSPVLTLRFKTGGTLFLITSLPINNATGNDFEISLLVTTRTTGIVGLSMFIGSFQHSTTTGVPQSLTLGTGSVQSTDLTVARLVDVTAQWGTAHPSNTITSLISTLEILN